MFETLTGKKTYIIAAVTFVTAGLSAIGLPVPAWIYPLLGALGVGALRSGIGSGAGPTRSADDQRTDK